MRCYPILWQVTLAAVPVGMFGLADYASADVLEIDGGEARWVAGGPQQSITPHAVTASLDTRSHAVPPKYHEHIANLSARYDLSPALIEALVWQESRWREDALSPKGARGLAQLMPATARYLGVDPDDPIQNLEGGARYLREQLDRFDGNLEWALAAYNAGPGRVERAQGIPRIRETQQYVASIMARLTRPHTNSEAAARSLAEFDYKEMEDHDVAYLSR